jgi:hypothetical protein
MARHLIGYLTELPVGARLALVALQLSASLFLGRGELTSKDVDKHIGANLPGSISQYPGAGVLGH